MREKGKNKELFDHIGNDNLRTTFKIADKTKIVDGVTLHQIVALPGNKFATPGTLGGWVEREENLSGDAWVADNACVYGNAEVFGNTLIEDDAQVYGDAKIHGITEEPLTISWDLKVHGGDWIETPYYGSGAIWTINISSPDTVRIGCRDYSFEKWHKSYKAILRMYHLENIDENGVVECVEVYNNICCRYGKVDYMVSLDEILDSYRKARAEAALTIVRALPTI